MPMYGAWKQAGRKLTKIADAADRGLQAGIEEAAFGYQVFLVEGLRSNRFNLQAKSPATLRSEPDKANPMIRHGFFVKSIKAVRAGKHLWFTGVQMNAKNRDGSKLYDIARFHEYGGVIRPKKNPGALAIPMTRAASRAGGPRNYPGELEMIWGKGKKSGGLYEWQGKNKDKFKMVYLLVRKVVMPKRPWRKTSWAEYQPIARNTVANRVARALKAA